MNKPRIYYNCREALRGYLVDKGCCRVARVRRGRGDTIVGWYNQSNESSSGATEIEAPETAAQCATGSDIGGTDTLVYLKVE